MCVHIMCIQEHFPLDMDIRRSVAENMAYAPQQQLESLINRMHKVSNECILSIVIHYMLMSAICIHVMG